MVFIDSNVQVYDLFVQICPSVLPVTLADTDRAKDLLMERPDAGARDAIHAAVMLNNDVRRIASFDTGFDGFPGIEPVALD